jgi:response regulator RpfG family c-di-GMP phosphodiesterase
MEPKFAFLIIEDNKIDQFIALKLLKDKNYVSEINIANSGKEGLIWLHDTRKKIDESLIILLDIRMPIMNGFDFLIEYEKLEDELKRETQIFMLSSTLDIDEIKHVKANTHVTDFLNKPLCIKELSKRISPDL